MPLLGNFYGQRPPMPAQAQTAGPNQQTFMANRAIQRRGPAPAGARPVAPQGMGQQPAMRGPAIPQMPAQAPAGMPARTGMPALGAFYGQRPMGPMGQQIPPQVLAAILARLRGVRGM